MKQLCKLNFLLCFRFKTMGLLLLLFIIIAFTRGISLLNKINKPSVEPTLGDFLFICLGGMSDKDYIIEFLGWICSISPLLILVYYIVSATKGYDLFLLSRVKTRAQWWIGKSLSIAILTLLYMVIYVLIHIVVGIMLTQTTLSLSTYTLSKYSEISSYANSPTILFIMMSSVLLSGLITIALLAQNGNLFFRNSSASYIILFIVLCGTGQMYLISSFPREFAIPFYASTVDLFNVKEPISTSIWQAVVFNACLSVLLLLVGLIKVVKSKNISEQG